MDSHDKPGFFRLLKSTDTKDGGVSTSAKHYLSFYGTEEKGSSVEKTKKKRKDDSTVMTGHYYDLATDFFEYGWGESFHFAALRKGESREHAFAKHEYKLALKLVLSENDSVLDAGCGVGGPARHIAALSGAKIIGLNYSRYQLKRCEDLTKKAGLEKQCQYVWGDFNKMPFSDSKFDKAYAIEATCHSSNQALTYSEVYRVLKPGALFANYEWIMTDAYDPNNKYHRKIKEDIMEGDSLPDINTAQGIKEAYKKAGFEILESSDLALQSQIPWQSVLEPQWSISDLKSSPLGRWTTHFMLYAMETFRLAPKGSVKTHRMLCKGADGLVLGGQEGIFTPMYFVLARKPNKN